MLRASPVPPELFWFLGVFLAHFAASIILGALWLGGSGVGWHRVVSEVFLALQIPMMTPVSSLAWGLGAALLAGGIRRLRRVP